MLLIVGPLPPPYIGPAVATERLMASAVIAEAFRLELLDTCDADGEKDIGRFTLHNVGQAFSQLFEFWWRILRRRPNAVYISIARGMWGFLRDACMILPARMVGARVLVHLRAGRFDLIHDCGLPGRLLARIGLAPVSRALVLGESVRDVFGGYVPAERVRVVPNGIDLAAWPPPVPRCGAAGGFHVVYLANLFRDKGLHIVLDALREVVREHPDAMLSVAGKWHDNNYRAECLRFIDEHNLTDHVRFLGVVKGNGKRELLDSADAVTFVPVAPEGSPWVVLEAMAAGRSVIGTPQGTMRELIVDGETGYLIPPGDAPALARRLLALAAAPELRCALGTAARRRIEGIYAECRTHARLVDVVHDALGTTAPR